MFEILGQYQALVYDSPSHDANDAKESPIQHVTLFYNISNTRKQIPKTIKRQFVNQ